MRKIYELSSDIKTSESLKKNVKWLDQAPLKQSTGGQQFIIKLCIPSFIWDVSINNKIKHFIQKNPLRWATDVAGEITFLDPSAGVWWSGYNFQEMASSDVDVDKCTEYYIGETSQSLKKRLQQHCQLHQWSPPQSQWPWLWLRRSEHSGPWEPLVWGRS